MTINVDFSITELTTPVFSLFAVQHLPKDLTEGLVRSMCDAAAGYHADNGGAGSVLKAVPQPPFPRMVREREGWREGMNTSMSLLFTR